MGQKIKPGMWCDYCQSPTVGQKEVKRVRNWSAIAAYPVTGGVSGFAMSNAQQWHCQTCGLPVITLALAQFRAGMMTPAPEGPTRGPDRPSARQEAMEGLRVAAIVLAVVLVLAAIVAAVVAVA